MIAAVRLARRLRRDTGGLALLEFALTLPLVLTVGVCGTELSYVAITNLKVSQYALNLADNASRVGVVAGNGVEQLREADVNDVLTGAKLEGQAIGLTTYGRVTLTSLENVQQNYDSGPVQRIHWQRCIGVKSGTNFDSTWDKTSITAGSDNTQANAGVAEPSGYGPGSPQVSASPGNGVIFVEVNYQYQPLFPTMYTTLFGPAPVIHYIASYVIRDNRDYSQLYNFTPAAVRSTCDLHTAGAGGAAS